jgi:hypothetical protein
MDALEIGDQVKTGVSPDGHDEYSPVISMMHMDPHAELKYIQIFMDDASDLPLEVSEDHFVYLSNDKIVRAQDVQIGDRLKGDAIKNKNMVVTDIQEIQRRGMYAPGTENGKIWVSGVTASCYVSLLNTVSADMQAMGMHMALAPLRMACNRGSFSICKDEMYSDEGYFANLLAMVKFGLHVWNLSGLFQFATAMTFSPLLLLFAGLEMILNHVILAVASVGTIIAFTKMNAMMKKVAK